MMEQAEPGFIDELQGKLPSPLRWCFCGAGAAAGWYYARAGGSSIPLSYIIAGASLGFCLTGLVFAGLRVLKMAAIVGGLLLVLNYAVLIPYGYGDHLPEWIAAGRSALRWLNPAPLVHWAKDGEIRPPVRR